MSGELDPRPDLVEEFRVLRDKIRDLESRISGDESGLDLSDLNDVRVDSLGDGTITLVDGSALVFRSADKIWVPGSAGSLLTDSYYEFIDDVTTNGKSYLSGDVENKWDFIGGGFNNGSDVTLVSGKVTIVTTGIYSVSATWDVQAETAADTYSVAHGRFTVDRVNEPGSPVHDQVFLDDLKVPAVIPADDQHAAYFNSSFVGFMYAGDQIICEAYMSASADPGSLWGFLTASMYVERLA